MMTRTQGIEKVAIGIAAEAWNEERQVWPIEINPFIIGPWGPRAEDYDTAAAELGDMDEGEREVFNRTYSDQIRARIWTLRGEL